MIVAAMDSTMTKKPANPKLHIANEMRCLDLKDRGFYDSLTDEERKKFSNYLMIRWGSSVEARSEMQEFYLISTNERLNKHFFAINRHPKLQWLCATAISPGFGQQQHVWIAASPKNARNQDRKKQLARLFPKAKQDEIELLAELNDQDTVDQYVRDLGLGP